MPENERLSHRRDVPLGNRTSLVRRESGAGQDYGRYI
jgi:hypothetical protein